MTAAEKILQRTLAESSLDSRQWNSIQAGLRDRAFFSSQIESARVLHAARKMAAEAAAGGISASEFRREMRKVLARDDYRAPREGTIKDMRTKQRLDVVLRTNVEQARGYVRHLEATTPGGFAAFPAQELVRVRQRKQPREWARKWHDAGGKIYGGRMIALKDDPVWTRISRFGVPYPPFDFGSGMGVRGVSRKDAVALGVIDDASIREKVEELRRKPQPGFNDGLEAEIPMRHDSPEADALRKAFGLDKDERGGLVSFDGNVVRWHGERIRDVFEGKIRRVPLGRGFDGRNLSLSHAIINEHIRKHVGANDRDSRNVPLDIGDFELLPAAWRKPDRVVRENGCDHLELDTFDGILHVIVDPVSGISTIYKQKTPEGA